MFRGLVCSDDLAHRHIILIDLQTVNFFLLSIQNA
jgi:hypothetical protein